MFFRLWTRAPRTATQSCAITAEIFRASPNKYCTTKGRRRPGEIALGLRNQGLGIGPRLRATGKGLRSPAQPAVLIPVDEIQQEPEHQPVAEALPRLVRQPFHDEDAAGGRENRHRPHERHLERTRTIGLLV